MRCYNSIMKDIKKLENVNVLNINSFLLFYIELMDNLNYMKSVSVEKVKRKLNADNLSFSEYSNLKNTLSERKKYLKEEINIKEKYNYYLNLKRELQWGKRREEEKEPQNIRESIKELKYTCISDVSQYCFCSNIRLDFNSEKIIGNEFQKIVNEYFVIDKGIIKLRLSENLIPVIIEKNEKKYKNIVPWEEYDSKVKMSYGELISCKKLESIFRSYNYYFGNYNTFISFLPVMLDDYDGGTLIYAQNKEIEEILNSLTTYDIREYKEKMNEFILKVKKTFVKRMIEEEEKFKQAVINDFNTRKKIIELKKKLK